MPSLPFPSVSRAEAMAFRQNVEGEHAKQSMVHPTRVKEAVEVDATPPGPGLGLVGEWWAETRVSQNDDSRFYTVLSYLHDA
ncbi:hypothetical protein FRC09_011015, partial [Ceratobasidium sp. 395]